MEQRFSRIQLVGIFYVAFLLFSFTTSSNGIENFMFLQAITVRTFLTFIHGQAKVIELHWVGGCEGAGSLMGETDPKTINF